MHIWFGPIYIIYILHPWLHLPDISPSPGLEHAQCRHLGAALLLTPEGWIHGGFTSNSGDFLISWGKIWKNGGTSLTSPRKNGDFHRFPYDFKVNIVILSHKSWGFWRTRMNHGVWDWFKTNIGWFLIGDVQ